MRKRFHLQPQGIDVDCGRSDIRDDREQRYSGRTFHRTPRAGRVVSMPVGGVCGTLLKSLLKQLEAVDPIARRWTAAGDHLLGEGALEQESNVVADDR
jgi:hypothetical protein